MSVNSLFDAFRINRGDVVALVGAGGKTSLMYALGKESAGRGIGVVLTTTTRIYPPGRDLGLPVVIGQGRQLIGKVVRELEKSPVVVAGAGFDEENKIIGIDSYWAEKISEGGYLVVAEADGSAGRPFKGPGGSEPVIPEVSTLVVPVVGVDCLGKPLNRDNAHRPEIIAELAGAAQGEEITPIMVARVLGHVCGYRKNIPADCRWIPFINKVQCPEDIDRAREIALLLGEVAPGRVVIGAALDPHPVKEVVGL